MDSIGHDCSPRFSTPLPPLTPKDYNGSVKGRKRMRFCEGIDGKEGSKTPNVMDHSDPFAMNNWLQGMEQGKFGSVTKDIEDLLEQRAVLMNVLFKSYPFLANSCVDENHESPVDMIVESNIQPVNYREDSIVLVEDGCASKAILIIDSDDEEPVEQQPLNGDFGQAKPFRPFQGTLLKKKGGDLLMKNFITALPVFENNIQQKVPVQQQSVPRKASNNNESLDKSEMKIEKDKSETKKERDKSETKKERVKSETKKERVKSDPKKEKNESEMKKEKDESENKKEKDKGLYLGVDDDDMETDNWNPHSDTKFDGLADIWQEMTIALECSKDTAVDPSDDKVKDNEDECEHSFLLKDDIGYVCRICGVIQKKIETIIEYQKAKNTRNPRLRYDVRGTRDKEDNEIFADGFKKLEDKFISTNISIHPKHSKQMKSHQIDGFNFLLSNLVTDNPGGCILAHAPGSGKTFMVISFLQSFMAKYPSARPLIVLPKGLLDTWKNEFRKWQVENIPIFDCYSGKEGRAQQFEVLKKWAAERSILLVGYQQFSSILCDDEMSKTTVACQEILLNCPSIMILDEGHTPRNQDTNILSSLEKVMTPRKVVLSGTLYQNHVKEVFNILNLVRPKFLKLENSKVIKKRILSRVSVSNQRSLTRKGTDNELFESVEHTLLKDDNFNRKATVIQDLREMTSKVLHYYKGDCLEDLPGLVDFTVFLNLSPLQKREVSELKKGQKKFKISSDGSSLYVHPRLKPLLKHLTVKDRVDEDKIDALIDTLDENEGVKCKFYLNLLRLCESAGEKLLVFSQYLLPLKFLERLTVKIKGWSPGREIFMITGDSDNDARESARDGFNNSPDARVFFGSIKACGEGISLVGASRIIILDVHLNPSVTRQAIGRAFRPGQTKRVYTYRLIAAESPEEDDHTTCFKKESIAKLWFEWNEYSGEINFEMEKGNVEDCGDLFLETPFLHQDVTSLHRR